MSLYGYYITETFIKSNKLKQINKDLIEKIDGKYPWYFINIMELKSTINSKYNITLYGFDKEPQHPKSEGILSHRSNMSIIHKLYDNSINRSIDKNDLDESIRKYATYNKGAKYKK